MGLERKRDRGVLGVTYVCPPFVSLENLKQQVNELDEGADRWMPVRHWKGNDIALFFLLCNNRIGEECFSTRSHLYGGLSS